MVSAIYPLLSFHSGGGRLVHICGAEVPYSTLVTLWGRHSLSHVDTLPWQDFAVSTVPVSGTLHLRSFCSMAGSDTVVIGSSDVAKKAMKVIFRIWEMEGRRKETLPCSINYKEHCKNGKIKQKIARWRGILDSKRDSGHMLSIQQLKVIAFCRSSISNHWLEQPFSTSVLQKVCRCVSGIWNTTVEYG